VDPSVFRMVRLLRIMRVLRIVRLVSAFDALFMIIRSVQHCMGSLVWSFVVLLGIQIAIGMVLSQVLTLYIQDESQDLKNRLEVFHYFGTFTQSMITMFEITLANWVPCCRTLNRAVSEWFSLFFILYRCMFCFGIVKILTAVFITTTNRAVATDDECALRRQDMEFNALSAKLADLFHEIDTNKDGAINRHEIAALREDPLIKKWARSLEIPIHQLDDVFEIIDTDADGAISLDEFLTFTQLVRIGSSKLDSMRVILMLKSLCQKLDRLLPVRNAGGSLTSTPTQCLPEM